MIVGVTETFEAAHRLLRHQGRCRFLHGHSYQVTYEVDVPRLDEETGIAVDFKVLRRTLRWLTDGVLDHAGLFQVNDVLGRPSVGWWPEERLLVLPVPPTAECLSAVVLGFMDAAGVGLGRQARATVRETATSLAALARAEEPLDPLLDLAVRFGAYVYGASLADRGTRT